MDKATLLFKILIILVCISASTTSIAQIPVTSEKSQQWIDAQTFRNLSSAVSSSATAGKTILISTVIDADALIVPKDRILKFSNNGRLNIPYGKKITINGPVDAPPNQLFIGGGTVSFSEGSVKEIYPHWFGAKANGVEDDTEAIQKAIAAAPINGVINTLSGKYLISRIVLKSNLAFVGQKSEFIIAPNTTSTYPTLHGHLYGVRVENVIIDNIKIDGSSQNQHPDLTKYWWSCIRFYDSNNIVIRNCETYNATESGIVILGGKNNSIDNCVAHDNKLVGFRLGSSPNSLTQNSSISNCVAYDNYNDKDLTPDGFIIDNCKYCTVTKITAYYAKGRVGSGVKIYETYYSTFSDIVANRNSWQGIHLERSQYNTFRNVTTNENGNSGTHSTGNGIFIKNASNNDFDGGQSNYNIKDASEGAGAVILATDNMSSNNTFKGFKFIGNSFAGVRIYVGDARHNTIENNYFENNGRYGIWTMQNNTYILNNQFTNTLPKGKIAIYLAKQKGVQSKNHVIKDNIINTYGIGIFSEEKMQANENEIINNLIE